MQFIINWFYSWFGTREDTPEEIIEKILDCKNLDECITKKSLDKLDISQVLSIIKQSSKEKILFIINLLDENAIVQIVQRSSYNSNLIDLLKTLDIEKIINLVNASKDSKLLNLLIDSSLLKTNYSIILRKLDLNKFDLEKSNDMKSFLKNFNLKANLEFIKELEESKALLLYLQQEKLSDFESIKLAFDKFYTDNLMNIINQKIIDFSNISDDSIILLIDEFKGIKQQILIEYTNIQEIYNNTPKDVIAQCSNDTLRLLDKEKEVEFNSISVDKQLDIITKFLNNDEKYTFIKDQFNFIDILQNEDNRLLEILYYGNKNKFNSFIEDFFKSGNHIFPSNFLGIDEQIDAAICSIIDCQALFKNCLDDYCSQSRVVKLPSGDLPSYDEHNYDL